MTSLEGRIREIEEELRRTPYNKATQRHIGRLKARLAKLRQETARRSRAAPTEGVRKSGDATVALVGYPSVGKSTLLNSITEARSKVGDYDFTTLRAVPGVVSHKGARIQVIDLPGLAPGAASGRGRGREVLSQIRIADLLVLMVDVHRPEVGPLLDELRAAGIRPNEEPPKVTVKPRGRGGIDVNFTIGQTELNEEVVKDVLREWGMANAEVVIREPITLDRLVDHLAGNRVYVPALVALNKVDLVASSDVQGAVAGQSGWKVIPISAKEGTGVEQLLDAIYADLSLIRVYLRPPGTKAPSAVPLVLRKRATVADVCRILHRDFLKGFKSAQVWGSSARFPGQVVGLGHQLEDGDTLTLHTRT